MCRPLGNNPYGLIVNPRFGIACSLNFWAATHVGSKPCTWSDSKNHSQQSVPLPFSKTLLNWLTSLTKSFTAFCNSVVSLCIPLKDWTCPLLNMEVKNTHTKTAITSKGMYWPRSSLLPTPCSLLGGSRGCSSSIWADSSSETFGERPGILNEWSDVINRMRKQSNQ